MMSAEQRLRDLDPFNRVNAGMRYMKERHQKLMDLVTGGPTRRMLQLQHKRQLQYQRLMSPWERVQQRQLQYQKLFNPLGKLQKLVTRLSTVRTLVTHLQQVPLKSQQYRVVRKPKKRLPLHLRFAGIKAPRLQKRKLEEPVPLVALAIRHCIVTSAP